MTELNMNPTRCVVRIKATYTNRIPSGGVSYAPFRHFVLLKKYIVYGQGPIACICASLTLRKRDNSNRPNYWLSFECLDCVTSLNIDFLDLLIIGSHKMSSLSGKGPNMRRRYLSYTSVLNICPDNQHFS